MRTTRRRVVALGAVLFAVGGGAIAVACTLDPGGLENDFPMPDAAIDVAIDVRLPDGGCSGVDTQNDPNNCGGCGHVCPGGANAVATCGLGTCGMRCAAGFSDCNGRKDDGCEVPTSDDPANCGACGRDCAGTACTASTCQPAVLASSQQRPFGLAIDGQYVFWTVYGASDGQGQLLRAMLDGSSPTVLASTLKNPTGIALDATNVYWTNQGTGPNYQDGSVQSIGKDGACGGVMPCPRVILNSNLTQPTGIALIGNRLFFTWANQSFYGVINTDGTGYSINGTGLFPFWAASDNVADVYFSTRGSLPGQGTLERGGVDGGKATVIADASTPLGLAVDTSSLYVAESGNGTIGKYARDGGALGPVLAMQQSHPAFVAVDADTVYWTAQGTGSTDGYVAAIGKDGTCPASWPQGCPRMYATNQGVPTMIAVDAKWIYWVDSQAGTVLRVAK